MLSKVKLALRITSSAFDDELTDMIRAGYLDLGIAGVDTAPSDDPLICMAVIAYCKLHFGTPERYEQMKDSYEEIRGRLRSSTGYTDWGD